MCNQTEHYLDPYDHIQKKGLGQKTICPQCVSDISQYMFWCFGYVYANIIMLVVFLIDIVIPYL